MKTNLYNDDGSLCSEAQLLISGKPASTPMGEWIKRTKQFTSRLSSETLKEFKKLRKKETNTRYFVNNPGKSKAISAKWHAKDPKKAQRIWIQNNSKWRDKNPDYEKQRRAKNPGYINDYHKQRKAKDPLYRLQCNMRLMGNRVVKQLALGKKPACTEKWQGCTAEELKAYLESLFTEGMSWENYGKYGWHIDHIRPVSSFKFEEWEQINHYSNLQPLWAEDNLKKGNKY